jgi:hypothetical protein
MATKNNPKVAAAAPASTPAAVPDAGKARPVREIRLGRIRATIWANQAESGVWYKIALARSYKEGDEWKSTASFGRDDLLVVAKVADLAHTWVHQQLQASTPETSPAASNAVAEEIPF